MIKHSPRKWGVILLDRIIIKGSLKTSRTSFSQAKTAFKYVFRLPLLLIMLGCFHQKIAWLRRIVVQGRCLALGCRIVRWRGVPRR